MVKQFSHILAPISGQSMDGEAVDAEMPPETIRGKQVLQRMEESRTPAVDLRFGADHEEELWQALFTGK